MTPTTDSAVAAPELEALRAAVERARPAFLADLGLEEPGMPRLARACFRTLGLITFFTAGPMEARAWPVREGASALEAAGKIHSDIARGFIRAEVIRWDDLVACGSHAEAQKRGLQRVEGRDYVTITQKMLGRTRNSQGIIIGTARANPGKNVSSPAHLDDAERVLRETLEIVPGAGIDGMPA